LLFASTSFAQLSVGSLLRKVAENYRTTADIHATVTLTQQKVGQGVKITEVMYYRRDSDKSFLIVITGPESEKGNGYLRIDDNFWMYRKNTRTFQHINRDESIGGSDARGEDFEQRELTELYGPEKDSSGKEIITEEKLGDIPVYKFRLSAIVNDVSFPKKIFWSRKDNDLLLKEQSFSLSGTLMETSYYLKYTTIDGKYVAVRQMHIDEFEKGNKTVVELSGISTKKLDNTLFTKAYLENLSK
jgi:hypothetical protein